MTDLTTKYDKISQNVIAMGTWYLNKLICFYASLRNPRDLIKTSLVTSA